MERFEVEEGISQGGIAIWDRKQDSFKIVEVFPCMFKSDAAARRTAEMICVLLNTKDEAGEV